MLKKVKRITWVSHKSSYVDSAEKVAKDHDGGSAETKLGIKFHCVCNKSINNVISPDCLQTVAT